MKYCLNYFHKMKYFKEADELNVPYSAAISFIQEHPDKVINIKMSDEDCEKFIKDNAIKVFDELKEKYPDADFRFKLPSYRNDASKQLYELFQSCQQPPRYFFSTFVRDWDTLIGYANLNPCSIYISEDLGFDLVKVAETLHSRGIEVRCFANVAQSAWSESEALKKFFIRPEDVDTYSPFVDVIEFFMIAVEQRQSTLYKIYAIDKKWFGKLNEIIGDFNSEIDSRYILQPYFAEKRTRCGKACLKGSRCQLCEAMERSSELVQNYKASHKGA